MEQSNGREDVIIYQSNSSSAHVQANIPKETQVFSSDSMEAEASCFQQTTTFLSATADIAKPQELADGGKEDRDEEEEYIDPESGQVVNPCEGDGNAGEMQEGKIVEESKPLASASSSAVTTPGYFYLICKPPHQQKLFAELPTTIDCYLFRCDVSYR